MRWNTHLFFFALLLFSLFLYLWGFLGTLGMYLMKRRETGSWVPDIKPPHIFISNVRIYFSSWCIKSSSKISNGLSYKDTALQSPLTILTLLRFNINHILTDKRWLLKPFISPPCQLLITLLKMEPSVIEVGSEPRNGTGKGVTHQLLCLPGISPKSKKLDFGALSRSEVDWLTAFPVVILAEETAVPFCKRKGKSKIPSSMLIFFF